MAVRLIDLTKQQEKCTFNQSNTEEIAYAETFWQSIRLQPTMESRLVSSDIKQRLGIKKHNSKSNKIKSLFIRAHALEQIAQYARLQQLAEARVKELRVMKRRQEERLKKEEISRGKVTTEGTESTKNKAPRKIGEAYSIKELIQELDEFDERIQKEEKNKTEKRNLMISRIGTAKGEEKKKIYTTGSKDSIE